MSSRVRFVVSDRGRIREKIVKRIEIDEDRKKNERAK